MVAVCTQGVIGSLVVDQASEAVRRFGLQNDQLGPSTALMLFAVRTKDRIVL